MIDLDAVLRWGPVLLGVAGVALAMAAVALHVALARVRVALRNRRARGRLSPVVALGEGAPSGPVVVEGVLAIAGRAALGSLRDAPEVAERAFIETAGRRLRLDGPVRVTAGTVDVIRPLPEGPRIMRGARVRARGVVRVEAGDDPELYRSEGASWSLVPSGDSIELAAMKTARVRGHRWGLSLVLAAALAMAPVALTVVLGQRAFVAIGAPSVALVAIRGDTATWRRVWSAGDRQRLAVAAMSPLLRAKVRAQRAREEELQTAFPPTTEADATHLEGVLRAQGDCAHEALLAMRCGRLPHALEVARRCAADGARAIAFEARCLDHPADAEACFVSRLGRASGSRWVEALAAQRGRREALGGGDRAEDPGPVTSDDDALGCAVATSLRAPRRPDGGPVPGLAPGTWDDMLAHPDPACRVLGATRESRRDAAALGALVEAADRATTRPLVAHARLYVSLTGVDSGRITGPPCAERPAPTGIDEDFLRAHPTVALAFLRAALEGPCAWASDRVYLVAAQAFSSFLREAGTSAEGAACGGGRCEGIADLRGWMWQVDAIRAHRTLARFWDTTLRRLDRRYAPRRRGEQELAESRAYAGLPSYVSPLLDATLERDGNWVGDFSWASVVRAMATVNSPREWSARRFAEVRGLHNHQMDRAAVWTAPSATSQERAPLMASLVDYWRTGVWAPSRDAPAAYRSPRMRAVVDAATTGDVDAVLRALGAPDDEGVELLAAVAPRLTGHRRSAVFWLRSSVGYRASATRTAAEQVLHLARVVSAARRLRLADLSAEVERLRAATLDAMLARDPWVTAVLDLSASS